MRSDAATERVSRVDQVVLDRAMALVFAAWGLIDEFFAGEVFTRVHGSAATSVPFVLLISLPLAVRRRWPLGVLGVVMGAIAADSLAVGKAPQGGEVLFPSLIVLYTVAAHEDLPRALVGFVVGLAATLVEASLDPEVVTVGDLVLVEGFFFVFLGGASWLVGRYIRVRRLESERSEDRATRAEREQEQRAQAAVSAERDRIARELHDVISHSVSLMGIQAGAVERMLDRDPERAREALHSIQSTARESVGELRRLLGVLRAPTFTSALSPQPGIDALDELLAESRSAGLEVELAVHGERRHVPAGVELSAYRIVQEALTNVRKHAAGVPARVRLTYAPAELRVQIDNDAGAAANGASVSGTGNGIVGMRERVALYGGTLRAERRADGGFQVSARLPTGAAA
jgi:signal transduction histidine kinase